MTEHIRSCAVLVKESYILRVSRVEFEQVTDFDDPEALARASEGFCPFPAHYPRGNEPMSQPVAVEPQSDGTILCPFLARDGSSSLMRWEWIDTVRP